MNNKTIKTQQHIIEFETNVKINLGDVFYVVEHGEAQAFFGECEVCQGQQKITHNGYTFRCPKCGGNGSGTRILTVDRYVVHRYRVKSLGEELVINDWNPKNGFYKQIKVDLFRPSPRTSYRDHDATIRCSSNYDKNNLKLELSNNIYSDYKEAVAEADRLNAIQEQIVTTYNNSYGTNLIFEKLKYDLKSK